MKAMTEYLACVAIGATIVAFVVSPIVHATTDRLNAVALEIREASNVR